MKAKFLKWTGAEKGIWGLFFDGGRHIPLLWVGGFYLLLSTLLRLFLFVIFGPPAHVSLLQLPAIMGLGVINDFLELSYLLFAFSLYLLIVPERLYRSRFGRMAMAIFFGLLFFGLLYLCAVQYFFFKEFTARFNLVAVDYLLYPHEVFINIWESYPVGRTLGLVAVLTALLMRFLWPVVRRSMLKETTLRQRFGLFSLHLVFLVVVFSGFTTHSFSFFVNRVANELTANGISSFFQAFRTNQLNYDQYYRTSDSKEMFTLLRKELGAGGGQFVSDDLKNITRRFPRNPNGLGKLNVVVIVEESLGCEHVSSCGQGLDIDAALAQADIKWTPFLNGLARQGLFFNRAYATGTRTVRGLEAISASFPPIPSESIMKRPGGENIATWGKVMRDNGYHSSFLYGGYGQFDNMNAYFSGNGFDVSDRTDIEDPIFANIWGVSDQDLFRHSHEYFDRLAEQNKPFFSIIMTTSNHSPFTFPPDIQGIPPSGGGRNVGVFYADYALRDFFNQAQKHKWYKDTLFVVVADHGARVYGEAQVPLPSYEIPLLIFAPGHLVPRQIMTPISQMDIAPTVLGLLGFPYEAPFFGQDVLARETTLPPTLLFNHNHDVALFQKDTLEVLGLLKEVDSYRYRLGETLQVSIQDDKRLVDLATAYYQCAFELFQAKLYQ